MSVGNILVTPLRRVPVLGGDVLHVMKRADPGYVDFGEAYFSLVEQGAVKAWKRHLRMTLNLVVPIGMVRFIFMDDQGAMREEMIGEEHYARLTVPSGIWFGFKGLAAPCSLLLNVADIPNNPAEIERRQLDAFMFDWEQKR